MYDVWIFVIGYWIGFFICMLIYENRMKKLREEMNFLREEE